MPERDDELERALQAPVDAGALTGVAAAVVRGDEVATAHVGWADRARRVPLGPDARFRTASVTKPVVAALALALVEDGALALDDPIARWLPELAAPRVLRSPDGPADDVVALEEPVQVGQVLDSTCGWGFPGDLSLPGVATMLEALGDARRPDRLPAPDVWLAALAGVPLLRRPGERWLYQTSAELLGVLLARAAGRPLPALLAERLLRPLGMDRTGFAVAPADRAAVVEPLRWRDGAPRVAFDDDDPTRLPPFPSAAGGLLSTLDDLVRFACALLGGGALDGTRVLAEASVDLLTTDGLTPAQRSEAGGFLAGQSWGMGGAVDVDPREPWQAAGRYGWVGVTGTSLHVRRDHGSAVVVLTARELVEREDTAVLEGLWTALAPLAA